MHISSSTTTRIIAVKTSWLVLLLVLSSCSSFVAHGFLLPSSEIAIIRKDTTKTSSVMSSSSSVSSLQMSIPNAVDTLTTGLASIARLPFGTIVSSNFNLPPDADADVPPPKIIALYDVEESKECRLVRERITELDLVVDALIPSAPNSRVFNDEKYTYYLKDGNTEIPRMVIQDENNGQQTQTTYYVGADAILDYFTNVYGPRSPIVDENEEEIKKQVVNALILLGESLPSILRWNRGKVVSGCATISPDTPRPSKLLTLYSYEGNQFCRLVREVLTELDIPYELRSAGKGSNRRNELSQITGGSTQCPYLIDPNTDTKMSESKDIIMYLYKTYALYTPPNNNAILGAISNAIITPLLKPLFKALAPIQAGSGREDKVAYDAEIQVAKDEITDEISAHDVVIYTYSLSPFCTEAKNVLDSLGGVKYKEISLGAEWVPFLINEGGSQKRVALGEMTGQTSLPHVFVSGESVGGLYEGFLPALEDGTFWKLLKKGEKEIPPSSEVGVFE